MTVAGARPGPLAPVLSCVDANFEVLLRYAGVPDVLTVLGGLCSIEVTPTAAPVLAPLPRDQWMERCTGLRPAGTRAQSVAEVAELACALVEAGSPALVLADSFTVPWNPYAGHEHHEHGFVVDGFDGERLHVVDAYTNTTRYGVAEPGAHWIDRTVLTQGLRPAADEFQLYHLTGDLRPADPAALAVDAVAANVRAYQEAASHGRDATALADVAGGGPGGTELAWLSLAVWLITRSRQAHAQWWQQRAGADAAVLAAADPVIKQWQSVQTMSYLAWRRVEAGQPCPTMLGGTIAQAAQAEAAWFEAMAATLPDQAPPAQATGEVAP